MSTRAVIVALIVALALGGAAWYITTAPRTAPPGVIPEGARIVEFDPATVRSIRVTRPGEPVELVRRIEGTSDWELVIGSGTSGAAAWAMDTSRVTNLLR